MSLRAAPPTAPRSGSGPWQVLIPVRGGRAGKSRLGHVEGRPLGTDGRGRLALAMALDTVAAAIGAAVGPVAVLTSDPVVGSAAARLGAELLTDRGGGLNPELSRAVQTVPAERGVCVLLGDLPALRASDLAGVLAEVASGDRAAYVPDWEGAGTTLVAAAPASRADLTLAFGPESAARHKAAGLLPVGLALQGLRCDVDTPAAWSRAVALGVGPATERIRAELLTHPDSETETSQD